MNITNAKPGFGLVANPPHMGISADQPENFAIGTGGKIDLSTEGSTLVVRAPEAYVLDVDKILTLDDVREVFRGMQITFHRMVGNDEQFRILEPYLRKVE